MMLLDGSTPYFYDYLGITVQHEETKMNDKPE
jgi:hypothetical protein